MSTTINSVKFTQNRLQLSTAKKELTRQNQSCQINPLVLIYYLYIFSKNIFITK